MKRIMLSFLLACAITIPVAAYAEDDVLMKVKLSTPETSSFLIWSNNSYVLSTPEGATMPVKAGVTTLAATFGGKVYGVIGKQTISGSGLYFDGHNTGQYFELQNWDRTPSWLRDRGGSSADNMFLEDMMLYPDGDNMLVVNHISLENYMKGIAEVPEGDEHEKRKALAVLARSYAKYYVISGTKKFEDERYNASDSPAIFQKYLGYGFTKRSPKWQQALEETKDQVLMYKGKVLRAAYSSCSDSSGRRRTPAEANWVTGYFAEVSEVYQPVADPLGVDLDRASKNACGHMVGLSGLGATNMAKNGSSYTDILHYYYNNVELNP